MCLRAELGQRRRRGEIVTGRIRDGGRTGSILAVVGFGLRRRCCGEVFLNDVGSSDGGLQGNEVVFKLKPVLQSCRTVNFIMNRNLKRYNKILFTNLQNCGSEMLRVATC